MKAMVVLLAVCLTGCNAAIVVTMGARTTVHPLIDKNAAAAAAGSPLPCPISQYDDSRMAIVIVNRGKKTKGEK